MDLALVGGLLGFLSFAWSLASWLNSHVQLQAELRESRTDVLLRIENSGASVRRVAYAGLLVGPDSLSLWDMLRDVGEHSVGDPVPSRSTQLLTKLGMPDSSETLLLRSAYNLGMSATDGTIWLGPRGVHLLSLPYFYADQRTVGQGELLQYPVALQESWIAQAAGGPLRMYFFVLVKYPFDQIRIRSTSDLFVPDQVITLPRGEQADAYTWDSGPGAV